jgi:hypothetical protein
MLPLKKAQSHTSSQRQYCCPPGLRVDFADPLGLDLRSLNVFFYREWEMADSIPKNARRPQDSTPTRRTKATLFQAGRWLSKDHYLPLHDTTRNTASLGQDISAAKQRVTRSLGDQYGHLVQVSRSQYGVAVGMACCCNMILEARIACDACRSGSQIGQLFRAQEKVLST